MHKLQMSLVKAESWRMKFAAVLFLVVGASLAIACTGVQPTPIPASAPTPDIDSTVEVAVQGAREAESAVDARVAATLGPRTPVPVPTATPTPTPAPTATIVPTQSPLLTATATATSQPTATPIPTATPAPTAAPPHPSTPQPIRFPPPTLSPGQWESIRQYAEEQAGGPGAIYVGDVTQLVGPSPNTGSTIGYQPVPLEALERHLYVYESRYYQELILRAGLDDPTQMTSRLDSPIAIQYACVNRELMWCDLAERYFAQNLSWRTDRQVEIDMTSFPELRTTGSYALGYLSDNVLNMAEVFGPLVGGYLPQMDILSLYGLYSNREQQFRAVVGTIPELERLIVEETGGYPIGLNWANGGDLYLYSREPHYTIEDFIGKKTRSFNRPISDWTQGMGADPQFVAFAEVYTHIVRGKIDAAISTLYGGYGQRWYEVSAHLAGPVITWPVSFNVINGEKWDSIPPDLQEIIKEEAAKLELEALRLAAIQNDYGLQLFQDAGMEFIEFSPEIRLESERAAMTHVIPNWVERMGGPEAPFVEVFNRIHEPLVGVRIQPDGTVLKVE